MSDMKLKPLAAAVGLAFAGALAMSAMAVADAEDQLCPAEALERGYDLLADQHEGDAADDAAMDDAMDAADDAADDDAADDAADDDAMDDAADDAADDDAMDDGADAEN